MQGKLDSPWKISLTALIFLIANFETGFDREHHCSWYPLEWEQIAPPPPPPPHTHTKRITVHNFLLSLPYNRNSLRAVLRDTWKTTERHSECEDDALVSGGSLR